MATNDMGAEAQPRKQSLGIERTAQTAVYVAWRTGAPVRLLYRGVTITATQDTLIGQLVAEFRATVADNA